jgi:N-acetylglucosamine-6-phosphate deacetylase
VEAIRQLADVGITVSAGHTDAQYEAAIAGFEAGITLATHLFNAMSPWQSRSPGMVGAIFQHPQVRAGIIADGHHVHFTSIALAKRIMGNRLFLVTDATPPAGAGMDSFMIGGQQVFYRDGKCVSAEGTLGGLCLDHGGGDRQLRSPGQYSPGGSAADGNPVSRRGDRVWITNWATSPPVTQPVW